MLNLEKKYFLPNLLLNEGTVCFISTVTFHDNVAPKVLKIIQFCKKYLKDNTLAFNVHQFLGLFDKNWTLFSHS